MASHLFTTGEESQLFSEILVLPRYVPSDCFEISLSCRTICPSIFNLSFMSSQTNLEVSSVNLPSTPAKGIEPSVNKPDIDIC